MIPTITDLITRPLVNAAGTAVVGMGLVVDNHPPVWGHCQHGEDTAALLALIEDTIRPHLIGQPLDDFNRLCVHIECGRFETVVREASTLPIAPKLSRRQLLTGLATDRREKQPWPAPLRYALSLVCLQAMAQHHGHQLWAQAVAGDAPTQRLALQAPVETVAHPALLSKVAAVSRRFTTAKPEQQFGAQAERLQQYVRQLSQWLATTSQHPMRIALDLNGGLGKLYDDNMGKMLGALSGLATVGRPHPLSLVNVTHDIGTLRDLEEALRWRGQTIELVVGPQTAEALRETLAQRIGHTVQLPISSWGTVRELLEVCQSIRAAGLALILENDPVDTTLATALSTRLAQAIRPARWQLNGRAEQLAQVYNVLTMLL